MDLILAGRAKDYLPWNVDQRRLLPVDRREWLPEGHLALFVLDVVAELDLSEVTRTHEAKDPRGRAGFHPVRMVAMPVYGYCTGKRSSRKLEKATYDEVPFRVLTGDQHPDHDSIADFRKRPLKALAGLFVQVLLLCQKAGRVKLGHVSLDGTKIRANASKHKAMSYERRSETEQRLQREVEALLEEAERVEQQEDAKFGKRNRGDELPQELRRRDNRLEKIRAAKAALRAEARARAAAEAEQAKAKLQERAQKQQQTGKKTGGSPPEVPDAEKAQPDPKSQRNFTDPESRNMPDGGNKGALIQGYNAQAVVDGQAQVIVASDVTQQANDSAQLAPMLELAKEKLLGEMPEKASADAGYFSAQNLADE